MGLVYVAEHSQLGRKAALKILPPELSGDAEFQARFAREWRVAASLDHPNVVEIFDAGEAEGVFYIAMRLVRGTDLGRVIAAEGSLDPSRVGSIIEQAADALDAAHEAGLIHRDVKPGNVLLAPARRGKGDHVYLTDFGLAKQQSGHTRLTRSGYFLGTLDYCAPEQFRGEGVDHRADVYSLGCLLYECLTGHVPFERDSDPAVMFAHLQSDPPLLATARPDLPAALDQVIGTALAKEPDDRFDSCGALFAALSEALREEGPSVGEASTLEAEGEPSPGPEMPPTEVPPPAEVPTLATEAPSDRPSPVLPTATHEPGVPPAKTKAAKTRPAAPHTVPRGEEAERFPPAAPPPGRKDRRWLLVGLGVAALVIASLAVAIPVLLSGDAPSSDSSSSESGPSSPPVAEAHLDGKWRVYVARGLDLEVVEGLTSPVETTFESTCSSGPCEVRVITLPKSEVGGDLSFTGGRYVGSGIERYGNCKGKIQLYEASMDLSITDARFIDGIWTATEFTGTRVTAGGPENACPNLREETELLGKLVSSQ
jgi:hypothetical protein